MRVFFSYCLWKKLNLVLEFSVFVNTNGAVWALRCDELEERINSYALNVLPVSFKRLNLLKLALGLNRPDYRCSIEWTGHQVLTVSRPWKMEYVAYMAAELSRVSPAQGFFAFAKRDWCHLHGPDDHEVVICCWGQVLAIWWKAYAIHSAVVRNLEIVLIDRLGTIYSPKPNSRIMLAGLRRRHYVCRVRVGVNRHNARSLVMPANLRDFNLHFPFNYLCSVNQKLATQPRVALCEALLRQWWIGFVSTQALPFLIFRNQPDQATYNILSDLQESPQ